MLKVDKIKIIITLILCSIALTAYLVFQNNLIQTSRYTIYHENIPDDFDGYTIVQVSDLHNKDFGDQLTEKISQEEPDMIAVTGDLIDRNRTDIPAAVTIMEELTEIAPVFFVSGNHEVESMQYDLLKSELNHINVINMDNVYEELAEGSSQLGLVGIEDPMILVFEEFEIAEDYENVMKQRINELSEQTSSDFLILLSHRAELMDVYEKTSIDLVLTGHAHGGQIRLPFINGIYAPSQGYFPEYTDGVYESNNTKMVVSRGLGNSIFPLRINNRPELVVVILRTE